MSDAPLFNGSLNLETISQLFPINKILIDNTLGRFNSADFTANNLISHTDQPPKTCENIQKSSSSASKETQSFVCTFKGCNKVYMNNSRLDIHLRTHVT